KAAHQPLAAALNQLLPYFEPGTVIVPLPTAPARVRKRGYDQSILLAKRLTLLRKIQPTLAVIRKRSTRQLAADKKQRQIQAEQAFQLAKPDSFMGRHVWLIDDICTTGSTLSA